MKHYLLSLFLLCCLNGYAQTGNDAFRGKIYNDEYQVYIIMDLYQNNIIVPDQEIYGELPGYFGAKRDPRLWLFTDAKVENQRTATLAIINDYGSEDLTAQLTHNTDDTFTLKQLSGSTLKIAVKGKWVKIPKTLVFKRVSQEQDGK